MTLRQSSWTLAAKAESAAETRRTQPPLQMLWHRRRVLAACDWPFSPASDAGDGGHAPRKDRLSPRIALAGARAPALSFALMLRTVEGDDANAAQ